VTRPTLLVEDLSLALGGFRLRNLRLEVGSEETLVVLGPNGAGKSVMLETIAGFHHPDRGRIAINGRDVTGLAPERRNLGFVFQNFGLFPHLTVAQNVAFGQRVRRLARGSRAAAIERAGIALLLAQFGIGHLSDRNPQQLSPGEKQRVALARALATQPDLFLFDEPFSALDARTREQLREDLRKFLRGSGLSAIFVTHDRSDALGFADRIAVMRAGEIIQRGPVAEIFHHPADPFVAEFVGIENILAGRIEYGAGGAHRVAVADQLLAVAANGAVLSGSRNVQVCIRAEDVDLEPAGRPHRDPGDGVNRLDARIIATGGSGPLCTVELDCGFPLRAYVMARQARAMNLVPEGRVTVEIAATAVRVLPGSHRTPTV
jgi:ABC-type Fe3+/spermidine/putrescine transport system ATPase subunit